MDKQAKQQVLVHRLVSLTDQPQEQIRSACSSFPSRVQGGVAQSSAPGTECPQDGGIALGIRVDPA